MTHETIVRQLLAGHELPGENTHCSECHCRLRDGARITVLARSARGAAGWELNAVYCVECEPDDVPEMLDGETALGRATLGSLVDTARQTHAPALVDVTIADAALDERANHSAITGP